MTSLLVQRAALLLVALSAIPSCSFDRHVPAAFRHPTQVASPTEPPQSAVADMGSYRIRPCPTEPPAMGASGFTPQRLIGRPGAGSFTSTSLVDAGAINVQDGELWQNGGEYLPDDAGVYRITRVPPGSPHVVLLLAHESGADRGTLAAVEVRVGAARPAVWRQVDSLAGGTDGGTMALAGAEALARLRRMYTFDDLQADLGATGSWITNCFRYSLASDPADAPSTALVINLFGDGSWRGAIGYDGRGEPVDVVLSAGLLPWSLLGLPGKPPPEAVAAEPSAATSASTAP